MPTKRSATTPLSAAVFETDLARAEQQLKASKCMRAVVCLAAGLKKAGGSVEHRKAFERPFEGF